MGRKYLMSPAQKRLFSIDQMQDPNITYNIPMVLKVEGRLDAERFQSCISRMIERHEILRTHFELIQEKFIQIVEEKAECIVAFEEGTEEGITAAIDSFIQPFDLTKPPLMRAAIYRPAPEYELLFLDFHHIIMDGGSMGIFLKELTMLYSGKELELPKLQYKDYSAWLKKQNMDVHETYWLKQFADGIPEAELPVDYPRGRAQSFSGDSIEMFLDGEIRSKVKELGIRYHATEYMVVLSVFMLFLSRYSGKKDVAVGTPVAGRHHPATQNMLGMFVNTLVLKGSVDTKRTFEELLCEVRNMCLGAFDHQEYEFESLVNKLGVQKVENRNPIFDIMFALQNNESAEIRFGDMKAEEYTLKSAVAKFDLTFNFGEYQGGYAMIWEYNTELFGQESIKRMMHHFAVLLRHALMDTGRAVLEISCLDEEEYRLITEVFNDTASDYPADKTIAELYEDMVAVHPDRIALTYKESSLSYRELNCRANGIAKVLLEHGIKRNEYVGIIAEKKIEVIAGLLGILKAGGAYLPLDPHNPISRTKYILEDSGCRVVLGGHEQKNKICKITNVINLEELFASRHEQENPVSCGCADDLAYLIYTSGTTGEPKGAMIEQRSVIRLVRKTTYTDFADIRILQTGSLTFDASTFEIWGALLNGGFLLLVDTDVLTSSSALKANISRYSINTMWLTSSLYNQMVSMDSSIFDELKALLIGGEKLSEKHVRMLLERNSEISLINGYGPTECTTFALTHRIERPVPETIPIGRPIANTTAYIMNGTELCGVGMPGELCLGGPGVARGYLNREDLTAEKFIENPFYKETRLYRTGDLARWKNTGEVEYLGRIDDQVKLRGFRIELSEIEKRILDLDNIKSAAVVVKEKDGDKVLCAYFVSEQQIIISDLKNRLRDALPEYMIPAFIAQIEAMPVNVNGKIDTRALPEPLVVTEGTYMAPHSEIQRNMCKAFQEILECDKVGIDDSFFELGGDSIKAIRLVSKIREYGYEVTVKTIMSRKTVRMLEGEVQQLQRAVCREDVAGECRLTPIQKHFFEQELLLPDHFNQSFILEIDGLIDMEHLSKTLNVIIEHHDELRAAFHETQIICPAEENRKVELKYYNLTAEEDVYRAMEQIGSREQASLSLADDRLIKTVVYQTQERSYLLLIIHHLLVDGVSWRILLEDINSIYYAFVNGIDPELPNKTDSYKAWAESLYEYSQSSAIEREVIYWKQVEDKVQDNCLFDEKASGIAQGEQLVSGKLDDAYVHKIMYDLNGITDVNSLLLLGLSKAVMRLCSKETVSFCMEGHGRYPVNDQMVIDRTVGWFTNIFPLCISDVGQDVVEDLQKVKEILEEVPNHGIGYGILKAYRDDLTGSLPEITYNYLGEFSMTGASNSGFRISEAPAGRENAIGNMFGTAITVNSMIVKGELYINSVYDSTLVQKAFIQELIYNYIEEVKKIVDFCLGDTRALQLRGKKLTGIPKKVWDVYGIKALEYSVKAGDRKYKLLFAEALTEEIYRNIKLILRGADEAGYIDYILDMEQIYQVKDIMSAEDFMLLCENRCFQSRNRLANYRYTHGEELQVYRPSAIAEMFLEKLESSWVDLSIPVRYGSRRQLETVIKNLIEKQDAFRTSAVRRNGKLMFCEHLYVNEPAIPVYDLRYSSQAEVERIKEQARQQKEIERAADGEHIQLYSMVILRISEVQYEIILKISHCIWDKKSEEIFTANVQCYKENIRIMEEKRNSIVSGLMEESVYNVDFHAICSALQIEHLKSVISDYIDAAGDTRIVRYDTTVIKLSPKLRKVYADHQWDFSAHMAKHIICANTGYNIGNIPVYIVQEDRRYIGRAAQGAIGAYIDLIPMCMSVEAELAETSIQETLEQIQKVKSEDHLNLMEFIRCHSIGIEFETIYSLNLQNLYGLNQKQYQAMVEAMKSKTPDKGYEIVVNEYKDNLVFAYPVSDLCKTDIGELLIEQCEKLEDTLTRQRV